MTKGHATTREPAETTRGISHLITKAEVCKILGVKSRTVEAYMARGSLPFVRFNSRCIRFRIEHVNRFLEKMTVDRNPLGVAR